VIINGDFPMTSDIQADDEYPKDNVENRFDQLFPEYNFLSQSTLREKDTRKRKRIKTNDY